MRIVIVRDILAPNSTTGNSAYSIIDGTSITYFPPGLRAMLLEAIASLSLSGAMSLEVPDGTATTFARRVNEAVVGLPDHNTLLSQFHHSIFVKWRDTLRLYAWFMDPHWIPNQATTEGFPQCAECKGRQTDITPALCKFAECPSHAKWALINTPPTPET